MSLLFTQTAGRVLLLVAVGLEGMGIMTIRAMLALDV